MPSTNATDIWFNPAHTFAPYARPYDVKFKPQLGWTKTITLLDDYRLFKRFSQFAHWTKQDHERASVVATATAGALQQAHSLLVQIGVEAYGMNGPMISGGFHDDWPSELKDNIRSLAHKMTRQQAISLSHWRAAGRTSKTWRRA